MQFHEDYHEKTDFVYVDGHGHGSGAMVFAILSTKVIP
jgi:hypothetical protein